MRYLDKHTSRDKFLLQLEKERDRLRHAQWNAPLILVPRPYQLGWVKTYAPHDDIARRPDADVFRLVVATVNQTIYSRDGHFIKPDGDPLVLQPRIIQPEEWRRLGWPACRQRLFGFGNWEVSDAHHRRHYDCKLRVVGFKLLMTWWLVEKTQPFIVTHQRVDLPEVRRRLAEIDAYMTARQGWQRLSNLHGHKYAWRAHTPTASARRAKVAFAEAIAFKHESND